MTPCTRRPIHRCEARRFGAELLHVEPSLGSLTRRIYLNQTVNRLPAFVTESVHRVRETRAVERMKQRKPIERFHFVALEVSYEMPSNRHADFGHFPEGFLDPVLTDVVDAGIKCRQHCIRPVSFCHRDNRYRLPMSTAFRGKLDARSYNGDARAELRKWHNSEI